MAAANPLQNLLEEATCPICLGPFRDPVITPCVHHFCCSCITGCSQEPWDPLCCPQCREPCSLAELKPNRQLQSMVELLSQLSAQPQRPPLGGEVCAQHEEKLKLFCQDDKKLICVICQVSSEHEKHRVRPISEAAKEYQGKLQYWLRPLQKERDVIAGSKQKEEEECKNMRGNLRAERMKTAAEFECLRQILKEQEQVILERLDEMDRKITLVENANTAKLSNQISSLETLIKEIKAKCEQSPEELLKDIGLTLSRCENVRFHEPQLQIEKNKTIEQSVGNKCIAQTVNSSRNRKFVRKRVELKRNQGMAEGGSQYMDRSLWTVSPQQDLPPELQKAVLGSLLNKPLCKGEEWYLINSRWFKQWKKYVGYDGQDLHNMGDCSVYPGPIDNSRLFANRETQALKEHLIDVLDYTLLPMEAWEKVICWYGCAKGQRPIVRKVIEYGLFVKHCKVEVYLLELRLCENSDPDNLKTHQFSRTDTIKTIEKRMRHLFNIPNEREICLWSKYQNNIFEQLSKLDSTVQDAGLYQSQVLLIEQRSEDGTWPKQTQKKNALSAKR